jgi:hypothetical protein
VWRGARLGRRIIVPAAATTDFRTSLRLLGATLVIGILPHGVAAQTIDTTGSWDGSNYIWNWGNPDTSTYGQTVTAPVGSTTLNDFTFYLNFFNSYNFGSLPIGPVNYQAFVYSWDGSHATGPALYASPVTLSPNSPNVFVPVTFNTGGTPVTAGSSYVLFFTTAGIPQTNDAVYGWGWTGNTYAGGQAVYQTMA